MPSVTRLLIIISLAFAILTTHSATANSRPPRNNDISNMADALKYLQELDTYYGDRARARFGKRTPILQLLRQHLMDNLPEQTHTIENQSADEPF